MKVNKKGILIASFIAVNIAFIVSLKLLFLVQKISGISYEGLKDFYPRFFEFVYWLISVRMSLFVLWLILFLVVNGLFIYLFAKRYNKLRELFLFITVMVISFIAGEFALRQFNFKPGVHTPVKYFTPVDSLFLLKGFGVDSLGIMKVTEEARQTIYKNIKAREKEFDRPTHSYEVYCLASEAIQLIDGDTENDLAHVFKTLSQKDTATLPELDKAILEYTHSPINSDGFRSIPFKNYPAGKPKILLLGDSFTWGHSTSVKTYSFADELLSRGYVVYNTGISGTDVAQYLALAKQYIPVLKPDVVIANFYLGNDITYYKRAVKSSGHIFYPTNAGILMAHPVGQYFNSKEETYNFYLRQWLIPENDNIINSIMAKTVITTLAWKALLKLGIVNFNSPETTAYYQEAAKRKYDKPYCNTELGEIKSIAEQNGAKFILSSIPEVYTYTFNTKKDFPGLFEGLDYVEINVTKDDYKLDDGHFNDRGHKRYADFLIQQIEAGE